MPGQWHHSATLASTAFFVALTAAAAAAILALTALLAASALLPALLTTATLLAALLTTTALLTAATLLAALLAAATLLTATALTAALLAAALLTTTALALHAALSTLVLVLAALVLLTLVVVSHYCISDVQADCLTTWTTQASCQRCFARCIRTAVASATHSVCARRNYASRWHMAGPTPVKNATRAHCGTMCKQRARGADSAVARLRCA